MLTVVSMFGIAGRFAGDLLTSALGWASTLLFGRVPRSHQILLVLMMAGSFLWIVLILALLVPSIASVMLAATPHPPFVDHAWLAIALIVGVIVLPLGVGFTGYLVPSDRERPARTAIVRETLRGYLLAPVISGLLVFLAGVGLARKVRSRRHGWSDTHVPIVVKPGGYEQLTIDLRDELNKMELPVTAVEAPWVLTLPARILTRVAGDNVRTLRPDRLIELRGSNLRIGLYPSDIAISCAPRERTRARAAVLKGLASRAAHLTTSAEAQAMEDRLQRLAAGDTYAASIFGSDRHVAFAAVDATMLDLTVSTDEWDTLDRLRLRIERDLLTGSAYPGHRSTPGGVDTLLKGPLALVGQTEERLGQAVPATP